MAAKCRAPKALIGVSLDTLSHSSLAKMMRLFSLVVILATLSGNVSAVTIGPVANLPIVNKIIAPDGYLRS